MLDYMLRRLVMTFFVVILIMTFLALLIHLVPGDPVRLLLGAKAPEQLILQVRHQMYLDKPVPAQVYYFFRNALHGNLGVDFASQRSVTSLIWAALPHTIILAADEPVAGGGLVGIPLGVYAATHPGGWIDRVATRDLGVAHHHAGLRGGAPAPARVLGALRLAAGHRVRQRRQPGRLPQAPHPAGASPCPWPGWATSRASCGRACSRC